MAKYWTQRIIVNLLKPQPQLQLLKPALPLYLKRCSFFVKFASQKRLLHKNVDMSDHTCEVSNYDDYRTNYKPIIWIMVQTLKEILDITIAEANKIIVDHPLLKKRSRANVLDNYYNLLEAGIQKSTIKNNAWLLVHENNKLKDKLNCIKVLNMDNDQLVPWLRLTQDELANYVLYVQSDINFYTHNRLEHLVYRLECSIQKLCELTVQYSFLLRIPLSYIDKKLNILHEYDITNERILKDLWVLRYSENHIRHRCELYKDTGNLEVKTWAIRCPLRVIARAIEKNYVKRGLMQHHKNVSEYLMSKLKVDEETLNPVTTKWPSILRVNIEKLDRLINMLHENGITSAEILQHERIFYFNIGTVQNRLEILKKTDIVPRLPLLILSEQLFERYVKKTLTQRKLLQDHHTVRDYLISKLNVDEKDLDKVIARRPTILRVNVQKLNEIIHMLQENGITSNDMMCYPRIFYFNTETLRKRIEMLKEAGLSPKIHLLTYSQKSLDAYLSSRRRKNNNV